MMKTKNARNLTVVVSISIALAWAISNAQPEKGVDYPSGFRSWQHVKSMVIQPGHPLEEPFGGIHHIYANEKAMRGLSDNHYVDGAVFVFDLLDYDDNENLIVETERKRVDVMHYDSRQFAETGGWGFDTFVGNSRTQRIGQDVVTACFECHQAAKETGYVYSEYRP